MYSKRKNTKYHFDKRLSLRYGIRGTDEVQAQIKRQIRKNQSLFLFRTSNGFTCHLVVLNGQEIPVIWDRSRGLAVTALKKHRYLTKKIRQRKWENGQSTKESDNFV